MKPRDYRREERSKSARHPRRARNSRARRRVLISTEEIVGLRSLGLSYKAIAKVTGVSVERVRGTLSRIAAV